MHLCMSVGNMSEPYLLQDESMDSKILEHLHCDMSSGALPIRQMVCCISDNTSDAGRTISDSSSVSSS